MSEPSDVGAQASAATAATAATKRKVIAGLIVVVGAALDLWSKAFMQGWLEMDPDHLDRSRFVSVIPGFFAFAGNWNTGVTFGLAQGHTWLILIFTTVACVGLAAWLAFSRTRSTLLHVALALVLAGAIGNLYDRVTWHQVRDFVLVYWKDPSVWQWPAFNLADSMIVVGVILILARELFGRREPARAATAT
jgi:signal peptidase II